MIQTRRSGSTRSVFADTGEEPAVVHKHLEHLRSLGRPEVWVRSAGSFGDDLVHGRNSTGQRFASIPAFARDVAGKVGVVRRQCTAGYEVEVVNRAIRRGVLNLKPRQRIPKDVTVYQSFGIGTDEVARAVRGRKRFGGCGTWSRSTR